MGFGDFIFSVLGAHLSCGDSASVFSLLRTASDALLPKAASRRVEPKEELVSHTA